MKLQPDDPRLSAWMLGELPACEAEEVARAVNADPALQAAAEELRGVGELLSCALAASALRPDQREAVRRAGRTPATNVVEFPVSKKKHRTWPAIAAAAAVVAAGIFIASRYETGRPASVVRHAPEPGADRSLAPYQGPRILPAKTAGNPASHPLSRSIHGGSALPADLASQTLPEVSKLPATSPLQPLQQAAEIELPLLVGRSSYDWVRGWIREKNELPPKDAVRIEELANAFPLPAAEESREFAGLRVACVSMASLWSGPGRLVGVQIANESPESREVTWAFSPAPNSRDGGVRVLASTGSEGKSSSTLPPGQRTLVLIELASATGEAGDLVVASGGRSKRFPAVESKDSSLKQAALVAAFGMWLRGEGIDDSRLNQILVAAGEESNPAWADSRRLMREALGIAAAKR